MCYSTPSRLAGLLCRGCRVGCLLCSLPLPRFGVWHFSREKTCQANGLQALAKSRYFRIFKVQSLAVQTMEGASFTLSGWIVTPGFSIAGDNMQSMRKLYPRRALQPSHWRKLKQAVRLCRSSIEQGSRPVVVAPAGVAAGVAPVDSAHYKARITICQPLF